MFLTARPNPYNWLLKHQRLKMYLLLLNTRTAKRRNGKPRYYEYLSCLLKPTIWELTTFKPSASAPTTSALTTVAPTETVKPSEVDTTVAPATQKPTSAAFT